MSFLNFVGLTIAVGLLFGCGANTINLTSLHQNQVTKNEQQTTIRKYSIKQTYDFNVSVAKNDTTSKSMKFQSEMIPFAYYRLPLDISVKNHVGVKSLHYTLGAGMGEGLIAAVSFAPFDFLQAHVWGSSWLFLNHKYGGGLTVSSPIEIKRIDRLLVGYGISKVNAYAMGCEGSCGLAGFKTVQAEISEFRHIFETSIGFYQLGVYVKMETARNFSYELMSAGIRYKFSKP